MTEDDHRTHAALAEQLVSSIERLRSDVEARSDPVLEEIARAMEILLRLTTHAHDHALDNRRRIRALEEGG
ncbi:MAG: hypothetical protein ACRDU8_02380 [Egibacteraceae bacterium]